MFAGLMAEQHSPLLSHQLERTLGRLPDFAPAGARLSGKRP
jgi:hypothetical protein